MPDCPEGPIFLHRTPLITSDPTWLWPHSQLVTLLTNLVIFSNPMFWADVLLKTTLLPKCLVTAEFFANVPFLFVVHSSDVCIKGVLSCKLLVTVRFCAHKLFLSLEMLDPNVGLKITFLSKHPTAAIFFANIRPWHVVHISDVHSKSCLKSKHCFTAWLFTGIRFLSLMDSSNVHF